MSVHHSHLFTGELSEPRIAAINAVIERFDAILIPYVEPGRDGAHRGWISSPNMGEPFDRDRVAEITEALVKADLWPIHQQEVIDG
jgi:hypothetical protein